MKKFYVVGLALFSVLAFGVAVASSASAAEVAQWLVDGATIALGAKVNVDVSGELLVEDMSQKIDLLCLEISGLGFVLSNGEDEIIEGKCGSINVDEGTCGSAALIPVNLPWKTQLTQMENGEYLDAITNSGVGNPGWEATCTILGIKVKDTCTTNGGTTVNTNNTSLEEVESTFTGTDSAAEEAECSLSKTVVGLVAGTLFLKALSENGLELLALAVSLTTEVS